MKFFVIVTYSNNSSNLDLINISMLNFFVKFSRFSFSKPKLKYKQVFSAEDNVIIGETIFVLFPYEF